MKALFVSPAADVYGSERSLLALLSHKLFGAEVVCPVGGELEKELTRRQIIIHPWDFGKFSVRERPSWHVGFVYRFLQLLRRRRPDVIVVNLDGNTPLITIAASLLRIPIIRFCRFEFLPPTQLIDRWAWINAAAVVCPTEVVRRQVASWMQAAQFKERVVTLYDPYVRTESTTRAGEHNIQLAGAEKIIGYIGRLHRGKRVEDAIRTLARIKESGIKAKLIIIGDHDGSSAGRAYRNELLQLAKLLNVDDDAIFAGYIPHDSVAASIRLMDVLMLPSGSESFGLVLIESWANGVPTVASAVGGCEEISLASGGGFVSPVGNVEEFSSNVLRLMRNPSMAHSMGARAKVWVEEKCSPVRYSETFTMLLHTVAEKPVR